AVGDPQAAVGRVDAQVVDEVELGAERRAGLALDAAGAVPLRAGVPVTADGVDRRRVVVQVDPADAGAVLLGHVEVAGVVTDDAPGPVEVGVDGLAAVTAAVARKLGGRLVGGVGLGGGHVTSEGRDDPMPVDVGAIDL